MGHSFEDQFAGESRQDLDSGELDTLRLKNDIETKFSTEPSTDKYNE